MTTQMLTLTVLGPNTNGARSQEITECSERCDLRRRPSQRVRTG